MLDLELHRVALGAGRTGSQPSLTGRIPVNKLRVRSSRTLISQLDAATRLPRTLTHRLGGLVTALKRITTQISAIIRVHLDVEQFLSVIRQSAREIPQPFLRLEQLLLHPDGLSLSVRFTERIPHNLAAITHTLSGGFGDSNQFFIGKVPNVFRQIPKPPALTVDTNNLVISNHQSVAL